MRHRSDISYLAIKSLLIAALLTLFGCSDNVVPGNGSGAEEPVAVSVRLFANTPGGTRSGLGETPAFDTELINSWWVAFVDNDGDVAAVASDALKEAVSEDIIDLVLPGGSYKAYAFANVTPERVRELTGLEFEPGKKAPGHEDVLAATWSLSNGDVREASGLYPDDDAYVPMTGWLAIDAVAGGINEPYAIEVVRVLGKVEFAFTNSSDYDVTVKGISFGPLSKGVVPVMPDYATLATPNSKGVAPAILDGVETDGTEDKTAGTFLKDFTLPENLTVAAKTATGASGSDYARTLMGYVRETANLTADGDAAGYDFALDVEYCGKESRIYGRVRDLGFINRNDYLLIPVRLTMKTDLELELDVQPYANLALKIDFGLMRDQWGDLMVVPAPDGSLPQYFEEYMARYPEKWPKDEHGVRLEAHNDREHEDEEYYNDDYFAIVLKSDGLLENADVILRDKEGCTVLSNFAGIDGTERCNAREVRDYSGIEVKVYEKDKDGHERLQHNDDHSAVAYSYTGRMIFKTPPFDEAGNPLEVKTYLVESFDAKTGKFWYETGRTAPYIATEESLLEFHMLKDEEKDKLSDVEKRLIEYNKSIDEDDEMKDKPKMKVMGFEYQEADKTGKDTSTPRLRVTEEYDEDKPAMETEGDN